MPIAEVTTGTVLILVALVALPAAGLLFARSAGGALDQIGKGDLSIGDEDEYQGQRGSAPAPTSPAVREEEIRQMVQARSDRAVDRGDEAIDVDAEVERLLGEQPHSVLGGDDGVRDEVRQLVIASNERRQRQGKEALDVEAELERRLLELEDLDS